MKKIVSLVVLVLFAITSVMAAKPTKALVITGQNNHKWQVSHPILIEILKGDGYEVDLALTPEAGGDMSKFNPSLDDYDLVVMDYNGDRWSKEFDDAFVSGLKKGKFGLILYHAADNAFNEWDEFESIIALAGWGKRGEHTPGYYTEWKDGKLNKYEAKDRVGNHGARHDYTLTCRSPKHPICKNLPTTMVQTADELYDHMKGKANIKDVLYTAYSDPAHGGTGREELLIFTVDYYKARIFHTMIGHGGPTSSEKDTKAMYSDAFTSTFLSGAAWASKR